MSVNRPPVVAVGRSAGGAGFVNYDTDSDGAVRAVPLWLTCENHAAPHLALVMACKMLDVKIDQVRLTRNAVVIPRPAPAGDIVIPVNARRFPQAGEVPLCMEVPLTGKAAWTTMYDRPLHQTPKDHHSLTIAYRIIEGKGATNLAIGLATTRIVRAIAHDEHAVLPVSARVDVPDVGEVCLSVPSVVGRDGVLARLPAPLSSDEGEGLRESARAIRTVIDSVMTP